MPVSYKTGLTLLKRGQARVLVNAMDLDDAKAYLVGSSIHGGRGAGRRDRQAAAGNGRADRALSDSLRGLRRMEWRPMLRLAEKEMTTGLVSRISATYCSATATPLS